MRRIRVIPVLLLQDKGLVKTVGFKKPNYIGDPINAVKIFNDKETDELVFLDINATNSGKEPKYSVIEAIASECFMPLAYGGGIQNIDQIKRIFSIGVEKVILNSCAYKNMKLIEDGANIYGSQSIVASVDVKKDLFNKYRVYINSGKVKIKQTLSDYVQSLENAGIGEIILTSVTLEGSYKGYDLELIHFVSSLVSVPVIANGGARDIDDFRKAVLDGGASAVAAGSLFVYTGETKGILINYPTQEDLKKKLFKHL